METSEILAENMTKAKLLFFMRLFRSEMKEKNGRSLSYRTIM